MNPAAMRRRLVPLAFTMAAAFLSDPALASGFALPQQGVQGIGRAQAGNAVAATDASTVFFNPAGMMRLEAGLHLEGNVNFIIPEAGMENRGTTANTPGSGGRDVPVSGGDGGNPGSLKAIPSGHVVYGLPGSDWRLGLGITVPFGLGSDYDPDWFGRYNTVKSDLMTVNVGPAIAYGRKNWSIAAGIDVQYADAEISNALPDPLTPDGPTRGTDGFFQLSGNDVSIGYNVGVLFKVPALGKTDIGIHYRSAMDHTLEGTAVTSGFQGGLARINGSKPGKVDVSLPPIASLGIAHRTGPWTLLGQASWFGWNRLDEIRVEFDDGSPDQARKTGYRDAWSFSFGADYRFRKSLEGLVLRGGFAYEQSIVTDEFRDTSVPDSDHYWIALGASWDFGEYKQWGLDFAASHIFYDDASIASTRNVYTGTPLDSSTTTRARATKSSNTVAIGLRYHLGKEKPES